MYFSVRPTKDTTITNAKIKGVIRSGSNQGASEVLELFVLTQSLPSNGKSRVLLYFDTSFLSSSIADGSMPSSSVLYTLKMKNAPHLGQNPSSFDLIVYPLSRSWDEGVGLSMQDEGLKDNGYSNWSAATSANNWTTPGSDFINTLSASQHFDGGFEDLEVDITNIVTLWLTGNLPNNGLMIKYPDYIETGSIDYFTKKFFSRQTHVPENLPRLDAKWTKVYQDDRNNTKYNISGNLFYYNFLNGFAQNVTQPLYANIINLTGGIVQTLTASLVNTGIYYISGVFTKQTAGISILNDIFNDVWFNATGQVFTGTFNPIYATGSDSYDYDQIDVTISNIKETYATDEKYIIRVFAKERDYAPAVFKTGSLRPVPILLKDAYYQISNAETDEVIVSFSTGSNSFSKLSYDTNGNYFELWTRGLVLEGVYKIKILANFNNLKFIFDKDWILKIGDL